MMKIFNTYHSRSSRILLKLVLVLIGSLIQVSSVFAHHPVQAKFDQQKQASLSGIVTYVDWRNPHAHVFVNVDDGNETVNWAIELESPVLLKKSGWDHTTLQPGDSITVKGPLARNETRQIWADSLVNNSTGKEVYFLKDMAPLNTLQSRATPRWPDGTPALGTVPGTAVEGYWGFPDKVTLAEDGSDVDFDRYGMLLDISDAEQVAPFQPWALELYKRRQARFLQDDPMYLNCKPPGGPRVYQSELGVQLVQDRRNERIFVLHGSGNHNYSIIFLDGREQVGSVMGDDDNPLFFGRASGEWDGDTLAVHTIGFNENYWFSNGGLPHTDMLELDERYTRIDADTLEYEVTINDPGAYTRPWTASWTLTWVGGEELPMHLCQENRP